MYLLDRAWFQKWKARVQYTEIEEKLAAKSTQISGEKPEQPATQNKFFGAWQSSNLYSSNSLGAKVSQMQAAPQQAEKPATEKLEDITADSVYSDSHVRSLE